MLSAQFEQTNDMRTKDQAMTCVIGRKVKILAEVTDLDILEPIVPNAETDLVKGFLTNALVELSYAGQLRWRDEERIQAMLNLMQEGAEEILLTNIIRVQATLDVVQATSGNGCTCGFLDYPLTILNPLLPMLRMYIPLGRLERSSSSLFTDMTPFSNNCPWIECS